MAEQRRLAEGAVALAGEAAEAQQEWESQGLGISCSQVHL